MTLVVPDKLTLISQAETETSAVTSEQADAFLAEPAAGAGDEKKPEPTDAADADNLVSFSESLLMYDCTGCVALWLERPT